MASSGEVLLKRMEMILRAQNSPNLMNFPQDVVQNSYKDSHQQSHIPNVMSLSEEIFRQMNMSNDISSLNQLLVEYVVIPSHIDCSIHDHLSTMYIARNLYNFIKSREEFSKNVQIIENILTFISLTENPEISLKSHVNDAPNDSYSKYKIQAENVDLIEPSVAHGHTINGHSVHSPMAHVPVDHVPVDHQNVAHLSADCHPVDRHPEISYHDTLSNYIIHPDIHHSNHPLVARGHVINAPVAHLSVDCYSGNYYPSDNSSVVHPPMVHPLMGNYPTYRHSLDCFHVAHPSAVHHSSTPHSLGHPTLVQMPSSAVHLPITNPPVTQTAMDNCTITNHFTSQHPIVHIPLVDSPLTDLSFAHPSIDHTSKDQWVVSNENVSIDTFFSISKNKLEEMCNKEESGFNLRRKLLILNSLRAIMDASF